MSIGSSTLSDSQKIDFRRRKDLLTDDQRNCLNKVIKDIADEGLQNGDSSDDIASEIGDFIKKQVLKSPIPDFCELYRKRINRKWIGKK
jgi:hypothetical protein